MSAVDRKPVTYHLEKMLKEASSVDSVCWALGAAVLAYVKQHDNNQEVLKNLHLTKICKIAKFNERLANKSAATAK